MERRIEDRYLSYIKVVFLKENNPGYLRDLNIKGCKINFVQKCNISLNSDIELLILPDDEFCISAFKITVHIKWVNWDGIYYSIGGTIASIPDEDRKKFAHLLSCFNSNEGNIKEQSIE